MLKIGKKIYRNLQEQVQKNMEDIDEIKKAMPYPSNEYYTKEEADNKFAAKKDLYLHSIYINAKLYDSGVISDNFIVGLRVYYFNNSSDELTADDLSDMLKDIRLMAAGYARDITSEKEYIPYELYLYNDIIYVSMATAYYSPAGAVSSRLGTVTSFVDRVIKLI